MSEVELTKEAEQEKSVENEAKTTTCNPLSPLKGFAALVLEKAPDPNARPVRIYFSSEDTKEMLRTIDQETKLVKK